MNSKNSFLVNIITTTLIIVGLLFYWNNLKYDNVDLNYYKIRANMYDIKKTLNDLDGDGLSDETEINITSTNPKKDDSDNDTYHDFTEIANCYDPSSKSVYRIPIHKIHQFRLKVQKYGVPVELRNYVNISGDLSGCDEPNLKINLSKINVSSSNN
jgi:hypothetical protein